MRVRVRWSDRVLQLVPTERWKNFAWNCAEFAALAIWTLYLLRNYLDFDPIMIPYGREYFAYMQTHYMWENAQECGLCAMWDGSVRGGYPVFADLHDSMLFPPVIVGSLIWGALSGAKAALIFTFFLAGIAQWWLAKVLGLGRVARVWSGLMAIAAGGLAGRMDDAGVPLVISTVCCMLVIPPAIQLSRDGRLRTAGLLGVMIALMLVGGQGYLQIGFAMLSPLFLIFILGTQVRLDLLLKRFALATAIGALIASPFLVPFMHFYPSFAKWTDPTFDSAQPFQYVPLSFVISDPDFFRSEQLGAQPYPYIYVNYVGWIAVVFAVLGLYTLWQRRDSRLASFFLIWSIGSMWISSAIPFAWIRDNTMSGNPLHEFAIGMRNTPLIAGLAIPSVLALSAVGVDSLVKRRPNGIQIKVWTSSVEQASRIVRLDPRWLMVIPLVYALRSEQAFAENFLWLSRQPVEEISPVLDTLTTPDLQWVNAPFGEEYWIGQAIERDLKLSYIGRVWHWSGHIDPTPVLEAFRQPPGNGMTHVTTAAGIGIYAPPPGNEYAAVVHADGTRTVCSATGTGGDIDVRCDLPQPGRLEIKENHFSGWKAAIGGQSLDVTNSSGWLGVELPAGQSTVELRYRPWDVPVGIALMVVGLAVAGYCIIRREPQPAKHDEQVIDLVQPGPVGETTAAD